MRLVIDIEGDQVRVHRMDGEELPPVDVLAKAAAMHAQSAGLAKFRIPEHAAPSDIVLTADDLTRGASDAGRAPSAPRVTRQSTRKRTSRGRKKPRAR
jgi:hypothetical protein